jgi:hypothetical protein
VHGYTGYGLRIRSAVKLSALVAASVTADEADVTIRTGEVPLCFPRHSSAVGWLQGDADEIILCHGGLVVSVSRGKEIVVDAPGEEGSWMLRLLLLGPVMAVLVHQRGMLPLHASAVAIDGRVCAFLGESGAGKSTLAAALSQRGHPIVTDDVLSVGFDEAGGPAAYPAFPKLRIASPAAAALGIRPDALPVVHDDIDQRVLYPAADRPMLRGWLPLHSMFVLAVGDTHCVDRIHGGEAFGELEQHVYVNRALLETAGTVREHFLRCARLTRTSGIYRLQRPRSLDALARTARVVEQACVAA